MTRYGVTIVTSKSSFLCEESKRRISRGYYRSVRPSNMHLCIYWAEGLIRGHEVVQERVNIIKGVHVSK